MSKCHSLKFLWWFRIADFIITACDITMHHVLFVQIFFWRLGNPKKKICGDKGYFYKFLVVLPMGASNIFKKRPKFLKPILSRKRQAGFPVWPFGAISPWSTWSTWSIWSTRPIWSILLKSCHSIRVHCPFIFATTFCCKERCTESGTTINWGSMHHTIKAKYFLWTKLLSNFSVSRSKLKMDTFFSSKAIDSKASGV